MVDGGWRLDSGVRRSGGGIVTLRGVDLAVQRIRVNNPGERIGTVRDVWLPEAGKLTLR